MADGRDGVRRLTVNVPLGLVEWVEWRAYTGRTSASGYLVSLAERDMREATEDDRREFERAEASRRGGE